MRTATLFALLVSAPALATTWMDPVLTEYEKIHAALASDSMEGVVDAANRLAAAAKRAPPAADKASARVGTAAAGELARAKDLAAAREAFKKLSIPVAEAVNRAKPNGWVVVHCSMAGASWVQRGTDVRNPYYGSEMLACGEVVSPPKKHPAANEHR